MFIASDLIRGHTETIILSSLEKGDSYGYEINKNIQFETNFEYELKEATLYSAFKRLEKGCYIESYWGNEDVGARRRYYKITKEGKELLKNNIIEWKIAKKLIDKLVLGGKSDGELQTKQIY